MAEMATTMARLSTDEVRAAVLDACLRSIAAGRIPTGARLCAAVPGYASVYLYKHRRALAEAGLIDWSHLEYSDDPRGLPCRTEADLAVIRERARLVRLGIDPDTGRRLPARDAAKVRGGEGRAAAHRASRAVTHPSIPLRGVVKR